MLLLLEHKVVCFSHLDLFKDVKSGCSVNYILIDVIREQTCRVAYIDGCFYLVSCKDPYLDTCLFEALNSVLDIVLEFVLNCCTSNKFEVSLNLILEFF